MKDINFDELDLAVSSALAKDAKPAQSAADQAVPTSTTLPTVVAERASPTPTARPSLGSSSPVPRRGGRFMDMVHNSSDMKSPPSVRNGKRLSPISANVTPDSIPGSPPPFVSEDESDNTTRPTLDSIQSGPADVDSTVSEPVPAWPDPLDVMDQADAPEPQEPVEAESPATDPESATVQTDTDEAVETPQTPFLSDTKVDKRPLGAFAEEEAKATPGLQDNLSPAEVTTNLPRELEPDIVAAESNEPPEDSAQSTSPPESPAYSSPIVTADPVPASSSIPQQYHSEAAGPDENTHSVFDTSAYHQPLIAAKAKRSHTWIWVIIVVSLLAVGAVLGALWFMAGY